MSNGWINCSNRMPTLAKVLDESMSESDFVLAYSPSIAGCKAEMLVLKLCDSDNMGRYWHDDDDLFWDVLDGEKSWVSYWMPLPTPPAKAEK